MFLARSASLRLSPTLATASTVSEVSLTGCTWYSARLPSSTGLTAYPTLARFRLVNSSVSTMIVPPRGRSCRFAFRAAGFIATSTVGASPGGDDGMVGEVQLERGHPWQGARRRADLGREVRQGGQAVAERGCLRGESVAGELHAVARVAGEPDDHLERVLTGLFAVLFVIGASPGSGRPLRTRHGWHLTDINHAVRRRPTAPAGNPAPDGLPLPRMSPFRSARVSAWLRAPSDPANRRRTDTQPGEHGQHPPVLVARSC